MAAALHVDSCAITPRDHDNYIRLMYTLFDPEDTYGLHIDQINGELVLCMDKHHPSYVNIFDMFLEWYEVRKRDPTSDDPVAYTERNLNCPSQADRKK